MNSELLKAANQVIPDNGILVNMMSRRVRQLSLGHRPLVEHAPGLGLADIALLEIGKKKLTFESTFGTKLAVESPQVVEFPKVAAGPVKKKSSVGEESRERAEVTAARVFLLTLIAMVAFAGNSLLCRVALKQTSIDAASFTFVRIASGALALWLIVRIRGGSPQKAGSWFSATALFAYAAGFSFAYITLPAGTGALLLFGAVQATMIFWALRRGEQMNLRQRLGLALAVAGLVMLVFPGLSAPPLVGSSLMIVAGIAWGVYSLRGKKTPDILPPRPRKFLRAVPMAAVLSLVFLPWARVDHAGIGYAVMSGAIASGVGYAIWYTALPGLRGASAASVQLVVPVFAALGGILFLGEQITLRFFLAAIAVLGGIGLVVGIEGQKAEIRSRTNTG